jgi:hypothetical protein
MYATFLEDDPKMVLFLIETAFNSQVKFLIQMFCLEEEARRLIFVV